MHSDPIADLLTRIRNGSRARLARVEVPHSKVKEELVKLLKSEGFIVDYSVVSGEVQDKLDIALRYDERRHPAITDIQRVSKPGLRVYMRCTEIPKVQNGFGTIILTTSRGLMTDKAARKAKVGGEALCSVY